MARRLPSKRSLLLRKKPKSPNHGVERPFLGTSEKQLYFNRHSKASLLRRNERKSLLPNGNIFVEKDMRTINSKLKNKKSKIIVLQASYKEMYWHWHTQSEGSGWYKRNITQQLLLSHSQLNGLTPAQIRNNARAIFERYYEGHQRLDISDAPLRGVKVDFYDNINIHQIKWKSVPKSIRLLKDLTIEN